MKSTEINRAQLGLEGSRPSSEKRRDLLLIEFRCFT